MQVRIDTPGSGRALEFNEKMKSLDELKDFARYVE